MKTWKRLAAFVLALLLMSLSVLPVSAVDNSMQFNFDLSVDGAHTKNVITGDIITVVFTLQRTDSEKNYTVYGVQNEIEYDPEFFELVDGSALLMPGIDQSNISLVNGNHRFYMNYLSLGGGTEWSALTTLGSFQLRVIAETGVSHICSNAYFVSTADGTDSYASTKEDVTVIVSTDCVIRFDSNGGSDVEELHVPYGEKIPKPEDPTRDGLYFAGWYKDIDRTRKWDFDTDTVDGNVTLYAGWSEEPVDGEGAGTVSSGLGWLLWGLGILLLLGLLLLLLFLRCRVHFETYGGTELEDVRVWRGQKVNEPAVPQKFGKLFGGWYTDEEFTKPWNFREDKVQKSMTLYARWN